MCKYRYEYFPVCQHYAFYLYDYCSRATHIGPSENEREGLHPTAGAGSADAGSREVDAEESKKEAEGPGELQESSIDNAQLSQSHQTAGRQHLTNERQGSADDADMSTVILSAPGSLPSTPKGGGSLTHSPGYRSISKDVFKRTVHFFECSKHALTPDDAGHQELDFGGLRHECGVVWDEGTSSHATGGDFTTGLEAVYSATLNSDPPCQTCNASAGEKENTRASPITTAAYQDTEACMDVPARADHGSTESQMNSLRRQCRIPIAEGIHTRGPDLRTAQRAVDWEKRRGSDEAASPTFRGITSTSTEHAEHIQKAALSKQPALTTVHADASNAGKAMATPACRSILRNFRVSPGEESSPVQRSPSKRVRIALVEELVVRPGSSGEAVEATGSRRQPSHSSDTSSSNDDFHSCLHTPAIHSPIRSAVGLAAVREYGPDRFCRRLYHSLEQLGQSSSLRVGRGHGLSCSMPPGVSEKERAMVPASRIPRPTFATSHILVKKSVGQTCLPPRGADVSTSHGNTVLHSPHYNGGAPQNNSCARGHELSPQSSDGALNQELSNETQKLSSEAQKLRNEAQKLSSDASHSVTNANPPRKGDSQASGPSPDLPTEHDRADPHEVGGGPARSLDETEASRDSGELSKMKCIVIPGLHELSADPPQSMGSAAAVEGVTITSNASLVVRQASEQVSPERDLGGVTGQYLPNNDDAVTCDGDKSSGLCIVDSSAWTAKMLKQGSHGTGMSMIDSVPWGQARQRYDAAADKETAMAHATNAPNQPSRIGHETDAARSRDGGKGDTNMPAQQWQTSSAAWAAEHMASTSHHLRATAPNFVPNTSQLLPYSPTFIHHPASPRQLYPPLLPTTQPLGIDALMGASIALHQARAAEQQELTSCGKRKARKRLAKLRDKLLESEAARSGSSDYPGERESADGMASDADGKSNSARAGGRGRGRQRRNNQQSRRGSGSMAPAADVVAAAAATPNSQYAHPDQTDFSLRRAVSMPINQPSYQASYQPSYGQPMAGPLLQQQPCDRYQVDVAVEHWGGLPCRECMPDYSLSA